MPQEPQPRAVFGEIMQDYLAKLGQAWRPERFAALGARPQGDGVALPFLGRAFHVSPAGITGPDGQPPAHAVGVILCQHLLLADPDAPAGQEWVAYKQFPDAAPFVEGFNNTVQLRIARHYAGQAETLAANLDAMEARAPELGLSYDLVRVVPALPRLPLLVLFNDVEGPLPAQCSVLFRDDAPAMMDMECLAMSGMALAEWLVRDLAEAQKQGGPA